MGGVVEFSSPGAFDNPLLVAGETLGGSDQNEGASSSVRVDCGSELALAGGVTGSLFGNSEPDGPVEAVTDCGVTAVWVGWLGRPGIGGKVEATLAAGVRGEVVKTGLTVCGGSPRPPFEAPVGFVMDSGAGGGGTLSSFSRGSAWKEPELLFDRDPALLRVLVLAPTGVGVGLLAGSAPLPVTGFSDSLFKIGVDALVEPAVEPIVVASGVEAVSAEFVELGFLELPAGEALEPGAAVEASDAFASLCLVVIAPPDAPEPLVAVVAAVLAPPPLDDAATVELPAIVEPLAASGLPADAVEVPAPVEAALVPPWALAGVTAPPLEALLMVVAAPLDDEPPALDEPADEPAGVTPAEAPEAPELPPVEEPAGVTPGDAPEAAELPPAEELACVTPADAPVTAELPPADVPVTAELLPADAPVTAELPPADDELLDAVVTAPGAPDPPDETEPPAVVDAPEEDGPDAPLEPEAGVTPPLEAVLGRPETLPVPSLDKPPIDGVTGIRPPITYQID